MQKKRKIVYAPMCADVVHPGHLNVIRRGSKFGDVVVGLLTDAAVASKKRLPLMNYKQRYDVVSNLKGVSKVIPQTTADYRPNLLKLRPDYVVHGNDWSAVARQQVVDAIADWNGQLIEVKYTNGISSTSLQKKLKSKGITPIDRQAQLSRLLEAKPTIRGLEAHNGLSALIVENARQKDSKGKIHQFDAIWISSLTDSIARGKPDTELVDRSARLATINEVIEVTTKPLIVDGDTGGHEEHFRHTVRTLDRLGVSAIVIEDKKGLKRNSLHRARSDHSQEDIAIFASKIKAGLDARLHEHFMIIARIESLILGKGQDDALRRAKEYISAGADAIMIHSKDQSGEDIQKFSAAYNKLKERRPLMLVPTSYNQLTEEELSGWGANLVVYANHLLRSAYPAMEQAAQSILGNKRAYESDKSSATVEDFLKMVE